MSWWQIKLWILPKFIAGKELRILSNNLFYYFFSFDPDSNFQEGTDSWILNILMPENQNNFLFSEQEVLLYFWLVWCGSQAGIFPQNLCTLCLQVRTCSLTFIPNFHLEIKMLEKEMEKNKKGIMTSSEPYPALKCSKRVKVPIHM